MSAFWLENKQEEIAFYEHDSHRAVAIAWAAIVENRLTAALKGAMRDNKKISDELFAPNGALGSFGVKIRLAYMLGIIHDDVMNDLSMVNKIRNEFAHKVEIIDFDMQPIRDYLNNLNVIKVHVELLKRLKEEQEDVFILQNELAENRSRYHLTIRFLTFKLVEIEKAILDSGRIYCTHD